MAKLIGFEIGAQTAAAVGHCPFGFVFIYVSCGLCATRTNVKSQ